MEKSTCSGHCFGYVLRLALGGFLLFAGIAKFTGGVGTFVDSTSTMFTNSILPMALVKGFLTLVPFAELVLGAMLLLGLFTMYAGWITAFLFALFIVGIASTGDMTLMGAIPNNFIYIFATLFLCKKGGHDKVSLDHLLMCNGKCMM